MNKKEFIKTNIYAVLILLFMFGYNYIVEVVGKENLLFDAVLNTLIIIMGVYYNKEWFRKIMFSQEKIDFSRHQMNFGFLLRSGLMIVLFWVVLINNTEEGVIKTFLGLNVDKNGLIITFVAFVLSLVVGTILVYGALFKMLNKTYGFKISIVLLLFLTSVFNGFGLQTILATVYATFSMYLLDKSKDLRLTLVSETMMSIFGYSVYYLHKTDTEWTWIMVSFFIILIVEFVLLNLVYDKTALKRVECIEESEHI